MKLGGGWSGGEVEGESVCSTTSKLVLKYYFWTEV